MLTDMTLGQYYPGHSYLHQMDPRAKILCTMIFIVAIFLANNLYSYIVVAASPSLPSPSPAYLRK